MTCSNQGWQFYPGIPRSCRARAPLFQTSSLQKSNLQYPSIGQKKLNGASSRMMVYFAMTVSADIFNAHPTNINRLGGLKIPTKLMSFWFSKKPLDFRPWMPAGGSGMRLHRLEPWRWLLRNMGRARCQHLWTNGLRKNICDTGILTTVPHQHYIEIFDDTPQHRSIWIGTVFFSQYHFLGLALSALEARKLRFPVRPKMHQLEHMKLRIGL